MILEYLRFSKDMLFIYLLVRPKVDISGASNLIIEGNSVNLTCKVVEGRPEPQITWLKNNTLQGQSLSLFFSEITKEDEGRYTCKAENAAGFDTKDIDISVKGVFSISLDNLISYLLQRTGKSLHLFICSCSKKYDGFMAKLAI